MLISYFDNNTKFTKGYYIIDNYSFIANLIARRHPNESRARVHKNCGGLIREWHHKIITLHYFYECEKCYRKWEIYSDSGMMPVQSMVDDFHRDIKWKWMDKNNE